MSRMVPLGAIFWGRFDGEPISLAQTLAMSAILVMVWLVQYRSAVVPHAATPD